MKDQYLGIATCQHDISGDVKQNLSGILSQMKIAKSKRADLAHFPECNLSGYGGLDIPEISREAYPELYREYKKLGVEVILQSWYDGNLNKADLFRKEKMKEP